MLTSYILPIIQICIAERIFSITASFVLSFPNKGNEEQSGSSKGFREKNKETT